MYSSENNVNNTFLCIANSLTNNENTPQATTCIKGTYECSQNEEMNHGTFFPVALYSICWDSLGMSPSVNLEMNFVRLMKI